MPKKSKNKRKEIQEAVSIPIQEEVKEQVDVSQQVIENPKQQENRLLLNLEKANSSFAIGGTNEYQTLKEQLKSERSSQVKEDIRSPGTERFSPNGKSELKSNDGIESIAKLIGVKIEKFQFSQLDAFEIIEKAIFIFGQSRIGKSALFCLLNDILLRIIKNVPVTIDVSQDSQYYLDIIGHGSSAKTKLPNIKEILLTSDKSEKVSEDKKIYIIDCQDEFTNKSCIMKVFNIVRQARFILCMQESDITNNNRASLTKTLSGFLKFFKTDTPNLNEIIDCTSIMITKTMILGQENETLNDYAQDIIGFYKSRALKNQAKIIEKINQQGRVYYLPMANKNQQFYQPKFGNKFKQGEIKKDFYRINHLQDIVFKFNQYDTLDTTRKKVRQFQQVYRYKILKVYEMCGILLKAYKEISDNSIKVNLGENPKTFEFIDEIQKYVEEEDIYESYDELPGRIKKLQCIMKKVELKDQQKDFAQIMFLRHMSTLNNILIDINTKINNGNYQNIIFGYLDNILNYGYIDKNCGSFYNFAYILNRHLEQIRVIQKIRPKVRKDEYLEIMSALSDNDFALVKKERQFIMKYKLKQHTDHEYLNFAEKFFRKNQNVPEQKQLKQLENKRQELLIAILFQRAVLFQQRLKFDEAFIQYEKCRLMSEIRNRQHCSLEKSYIQLNVQLYKRLGQLCEKELKAYGLAIEYYNVIQFNKSIGRCFRLKLDSIKKQRTQIYIQYATFLGSISQCEKAKQLLEEAYEDLNFEKSNQLPLSIKIKNQIKSLINRQQILSKDYAHRIQIEDIHNRPNWDRISKAMEKEMIQTFEVINEFKAKIQKNV